MRKPKMPQKPQDVRKKVKKTLKKEVHLPIPVPNNKYGEFLKKPRRLPLTRYFVESWAELKKVTWPSRKESLKLTFAVIVFTIIFTIFVALADTVINQVVERVLL